MSSTVHRQSDQLDNELVIVYSSEEVLRWQVVWAWHCTVHTA